MNDRHLVVVNEKGVRAFAGSSVIASLFVARSDITSVDWADVPWGAGPPPVRLHLASNSSPIALDLLEYRWGAFVPLHGTALQKVVEEIRARLK